MGLIIYRLRGNLIYEWIFIYYLLIIMGFIFFLVLDLLIIFIIFEFIIWPILIIILKIRRSVERLLVGYYLLYYILFISVPSLIILIRIDYFRYLLNYVYLILMSRLDYIFLLIVFIVKLSLFGFHSWLIKVHVERLVVGSVILSSIILKMGGYSLLRLIKFGELININIFLVILSLRGALILRIGVLLIRDVKIIIAYRSIIHINCLISSLFTKLDIGIVGSFILIMGHRFSSRLIFMIFGIIYNYRKRRRFYLNRGLIFISLCFRLIIFLSVWLNLSGPLSLRFWGELLVYRFIYFFIKELLIYIFLIIMIRLILNLYLFRFIFIGKGFIWIRFNLKFNELLGLIIFILVCIFSWLNIGLLIY